MAATGTMEQTIFFIVLLTLGLGAYWSLVIFPKQREFSKRQKAVRELKLGDEVITAGGIVGRVIEVRGEEGLARVEIAPNVIVTVITASILGVFDPEELKRNIALAMKDETIAG